MTTNERMLFPGSLISTFHLRSLNRSRAWMVWTDQVPGWFGPITCLNGCFSPFTLTLESGASCLSKTYKSAIFCDFLHVRIIHESLKSNNETVDKTDEGQRSGHKVKSQGANNLPNYSKEMSVANNEWMNELINIKFITFLNHFYCKLNNYNNVTHTPWVCRLVC